MQTNLLCQGQVESETENLRNTTDRECIGTDTQRNRVINAEQYLETMGRQQKSGEIIRPRRTTACLSVGEHRRACFFPAKYFVEDWIVFRDATRHFAKVTDGVFV